MPARTTADPPRPAPPGAVVGLPPPLDAVPQASGGRAGGVAWYTAGPVGPLSTPPLLLIHSINASGSAAEVKPVFEHHARHRRVIALDLPGFGLSERSQRRYTPRLMTDAIHQVLADATAQFGTGPVDALALSLSCEYLARAAVEAPRAFRSLALVSPTGFSGTKARHGPPQSTREVPGMHRILSCPLWRQALFNGLTKPGVIRYFLKRTWGSEAIDEGLWAYDLLTTRQPGALWAPLDFLSAALFSADVNTLYDQLAMPVWLSHGVRGDFTDYRGAGAMKSRPNWRFSVFPTGALPHFEVLADFVAAQEAFLAEVQAEVQAATASITA